MKYSASCNCINFRKASNNLTRLYKSVQARVDLKITNFNALRNIQKLETNIHDLSFKLELNRRTFLRIIEKLMKLGLSSYKYMNENKIIQLMNVDIINLVNQLSFRKDT